ncbi:MAG: DUF1269 domain-containing protein, partial [Caldilineaceae bacterium]
MTQDSNLVVLTFEGEETAATVYTQIERLAKEKLVTIEDAVVLKRGGGGATGVVAPAQSSGQGVTAIATNAVDDQVRVVQTHGKKGSYAAKGGGIGFLAGFLLGGPVGGLIVGAGIGAITAALKDFGISDKNVDAIKARLQPNTSALLLLGKAADKDAFVDQLRTYDPKVV